MSNINNEQRAEQMFEEMVEDNITKQSLVEVIAFINRRNFVFWSVSKHYFS